MKRALAWLHRWPASAIVALALAAMAGIQVGAGHWLLEPLQAANQQLQERRQALQATAARAPEAAVSGRVALQGVLAQLHDRQALTWRLEQLHDHAAQHGVTLRRSSYQAREHPGGLWGQEMQAELVATYPALRGFLAQALQRDEALALESLELARSPDARLVQARVRLVLYYKGAGL